MSTTHQTPAEATTDHDESTLDPGEATREPGTGPPADGLSLDLVFEALKNSRRRQVLQYLQGRDEAASVSELAEHVAAIENDTTVQKLSSQQRKRVYVGLYQCHLPKLDDVDVVEYDDDRGTVELGPNASQLTRYVDVATDTEADEARPWHRYYLAVGGVGALLLLTVGLVGAVGSVGTVLGLGLTLSLVGLAIVHGQESR